MPNKYQEALNKIINHKCYEKESSCWDYIKTLYKEEVESLQELVDKETPMNSKLDTLRLNLITAQGEAEYYKDENEQLKEMQDYLEKVICRWQEKYIALEKQYKQIKSNFKNSQTHSKNCYKKLKAKYKALETAYKNNEGLVRENTDLINRNLELQDENIKLKKAIKIIKENTNIHYEEWDEDYCRIYFYENEYYGDFSIYLSLTKEEYELLKEVLGDDR